MVLGCVDLASSEYPHHVICTARVISSVHAFYLLTPAVGGAQTTVTQTVAIAQQAMNNY